MFVIVIAADAADGLRCARILASAATSPVIITSHTQWLSLSAAPGFEFQTGTIYTKTGSASAIYQILFRTHPIACG